MRSKRDLFVWNLFNLLLNRIEQILLAPAENHSSKGSALTFKAYSNGYLLFELSLGILSAIIFLFRLIHIYLIIYSVEKIWQ